MKKITLLLTLCFSIVHSSGQTCSCESNFEWVKRTFEENDAGFQYVIDKKGLEAYMIHNQLMLEKIKLAKNSTECAELLNEWLKFFRSGHIGIELLSNEAFDSQTAGERWKVDILQFEKYISEKRDVDYEGIWELGQYKIGIQKDGENYIGFIIEPVIKGKIELGDVKLRIVREGESFKSFFYVRDTSPIVSEPELIGKNCLYITNGIALTRLSPHFTEDPLIEKYVKSKTAENPYLEVLNSNTLYLRIPSFEYEEKRAIDKVIASNRRQILKTENLIIDLRDNSGGTDYSFEKLLTLIYTNPIQIVGSAFLSTPLNNQWALEIANSKEYSSSVRKMARKEYEKALGKLGEFVSDGNGISIYRSKTVHQYPKNVGIIINNECASSTEQFLLLAKQSEKVKLFGTNTNGCLDISNVNYVTSPCKEFELCYGITRSLRLPDMAIDETGIVPDFYLDEAIPQHKWVEFVNDILNQLHKTPARNQ